MSNCQLEMATGSFYEGLTEMLCCPICLEEFSSSMPRMLPCLHVVCEECIQSLLDAAKNSTAEGAHKINCPTCRQTAEIPGGCPSRLPHYFHYTQIDELRKRLEKRHVICGVCKTDTHEAEVSFYCFQCSSGMCDDCHAKHDMVSSQHTTIHVTASSISHLLCTDHDQHKEHFCMSCLRAICSKCYIGVHVDHKVYGLTYESKEAGDDMKALLEASLQQTDEAILTLESTESQLDKDMNKLTDDLNDHLEQCLRMITEQHQSLCKDLEEKQARLKESITRSRSLVEESRMRIKKLIEDCRSWQEPVEGIPEAKIINASEMIADFMQHIPATNVKIEKLPALKFVPGKVNFGHFAEEGIEKPHSVPQPGTKEQVEAVRGVDIKAPRLGKKSNFMYKLTTSQDILDIDYINNNLIVVNKHELKVFNEYGKHISHYLSAINTVLSPDSCLCGVCVNRAESEIAITEHGRRFQSGFLHVFKQEHGKWQHHTYSICNLPWFVAFTRNCDFIVASNHQRMYRYNRYGVQVWCVEIADRPQAISVDSEDRIVLSADDDVWTYDQTGRKISTFKAKNIPLIPCGVCTLDNGDILVSDCKSNSVLLYDKSFRFVKNLIDFMSEPEKLAVYKNKYLAVSRDNSVYVYKI